MTSSLTPAVDTADSLHASTDLPTDPFAGLDGTDVSRIAAAMSAALAESTRAVYAHAWRCWERWCATRRISPLPAAPAAICAYLTERANEGASAGTLDGACSAIAYQHRSHGLGDPVLHDGVRQVRRAYAALSAPHPCAWPAHSAWPRSARSSPGIDRDTPKGARDAALILLGSPPRCDAPS